MPYITILGAGSTVFARQLITDILQIEGLDEGCFALVDIDAGRLELAHQIAERVCIQQEDHPLSRAIKHTLLAHRQMNEHWDDKWDDWEREERDHWRR